ncbi:IS481 family transposase [Saccharothrix sp. S26]|uniref:IS481 family transposase n=1 Tax=Saccharothrix sp. S26 TaxID=2907215 RepID=UPI001F465993|nr:IS481 family transposase [Saccharothrix sp. S26]MCE7001224.1 IS481 family transposase [Saccharothrix sp. S26]
MHSNARTTVHARRLIVTRRAAGWSPSCIAEQLGISRATVHKWLARHRREGDAGLADRSSRPHRSPRRTPSEVELRILATRRAVRRGPVHLAGLLGLPASTIGRVLRRHDEPALAATDPITGAPVRRRHTGIRYQRPRPGDLLHVDVKKLGRVPDGGGWRVHGRSEKVRGRGIGYDYLHVAVDDHTRIAYVEALPDEKDLTCAAFLHRAVAWFRDQGVRVLRVLTDNAKVYRVGGNWRAVCVALGIRRRFTKPGCPWTNGKAERFNRTLQHEFAYARAWTGNSHRLAALPYWVQDYNTRRAHSAIGGQPPITRLTA